MEGELDGPCVGEKLGENDGDSVGVELGDIDGDGVTGGRVGGIGQTLHEQLHLQLASISVVSVQVNVGYLTLSA